MLNRQHVYQPLTELDLQLAPLEIWGEASYMVYWSFLKNGEPEKAQMASLLSTYFPNIKHDQICILCSRGNRQPCWELVRWVAGALVLDKDRVNGQ